MAQAGEAVRAAARFLARLTAAAGEPVEGRAVLVTAHPDDETLACGAALQRLLDPALVLVTDGAPRAPGVAEGLGFTHAAAYAAARARELGAALAFADLGEERLTMLGLPDQGVVARLAELVRRLVPLVLGADVVLTHALEGGHPDHDGVGFAVRAALALLRRRGPAPALLEFPLYRAGPGEAWLRQSFEGLPGAASATLRPSLPERARKARMLAAHVSQRATLDAFGVGDEPFRPAEPQDVSRLPNSGNLLYERYRWDATGADWLQAASAARDELGLGPVL